MDDDAGSVRDVKMEDAGPGDSKLADGKSGYKSWKKKYRKMRITFDQKMHDGEDLHRQEQKAVETSKRLAVEIDRLLDMLLDINNTPQIPTERRFGLGLPVPDEKDVPHLDFDDPEQKQYKGEPPAKSLAALLKDIPHLDHAATAERFPDLVTDLEAPVDSPAVDASYSQHPPSFLTADDIDNYIYQIDTRLAAQDDPEGRRAPSPLPSLAPIAAASFNGHHTNGLIINGGTSAGPSATNGTSKDGAATAASSSNRDFMLRNPTSVYNWLRKHEPKTFLQDGETTPADRDDDAHSNSHHQTVTTTSGRGGRKSRGGAAAADHDSGSGGHRRSVGARASKRASGRGSKRLSMDDSMDYDVDDESAAAHSAAAATATASKRKRNADDDPGYRPKGGASRPTKRSKRKSEGDAAPAAVGRAPSRTRGSRKSVGSVRAAAAPLPHEEDEDEELLAPAAAAAEDPEDDEEGEHRRADVGGKKWAGQQRRAPFASNRGRGSEDEADDGDDGDDHRRADDSLA